MDELRNQSRLGAAGIYQWVTRLYSALPYHYFKNGYAFPAWHYYFEVTRRCNLRCKMCQYIEWLESASPQEQKEGELSTEEWRKIIEQVRRFSLITFTGGEPWVRSDFLELLELASRRARTHFISNATLLNDERAEACVRLAPRRVGGMGLNFVGTSIEGPAVTHDQIRRMEGAFERSMAGVRRLRTLREQQGKACPLIHATTVLQADNVDVLAGMAGALKDAGVDTWNLVTETRMFELPELGERDPKDYQSGDVTWPRIERPRLAAGLDGALAAAKEAGLEIRLPRMPRESLLDYYDSGLKLREFECRNAWNTVFIGRTGDVYPCWILRAGNVREESLKTIWNGEKMRRFRQDCQRHLFAMCPGCCFIEHRHRGPAA